MIKNYHLKAGRKRYHSRENWAKIGTPTSYGLSTLKVVGNGRFLFSGSSHTFTFELIFLTFLLDLGVIKLYIYNLYLLVIYIHFIAKATY